MILKNRNLFLLLCILLMLVNVLGCEKIHKEELQTSSSQQNADLQKENGKDTESNKIEVLLNNFIESINHDDSSVFENCSEIQEYSSQEATMILKFFKTYFENKKIVKFEKISNEIISEKTVFTYRIYNEDGKTKELTFYQKGEKLYFEWDNLINASSNIERKIDSYLKSIKEKKIDKLSFCIWNSIEPINEKGEIEIYPIKKAENVYKKYEEYFDISTLDYKFSGDTTDEHGGGKLIFIIFGMKNNEYKEHKIILGHGDGQPYIEDDWVMPLEEGEAYDIINPMNL